MISEATNAAVKKESGKIEKACSAAAEDGCTRKLLLDTQLRLLGPAMEKRSLKELGHAQSEGASVLYWRSDKYILQCLSSSVSCGSSMT